MEDDGTFLHPPCCARMAHWHADSARRCVRRPAALALHRRHIAAAAAPSQIRRRTVGPLAPSPVRRHGGGAWGGRRGGEGPAALWPAEETVRAARWRPRQALPRWRGDPAGSGAAGVGVTERAGGAAIPRRAGPIRPGLARFGRRRDAVRLWFWPLLCAWGSRILNSMPARPPRVFAGAVHVDSTSPLTASAPSTAATTPASRRWRRCLKVESK